MARDSDARGIGAAGAKNDQRASPKIAHAGAAEAHSLAAAFLADLVDQGGPWQAFFVEWADERGLPLALRRAVRIEVLRARCFGGRS